MILLSHRIDMCLDLWGRERCQFPKLSLTVYECVSSSCSTFLKTFGIVSLFHFRLSKRGEGVSYCGFNLKFFDDSWYWALCMCTLALCVSSFVKCLSNYFAHFSWVFILYSGIVGVLYMSWIPVIYQVAVLPMFSLTCGLPTYLLNRLCKSNFSVFLPWLLSEETLPVSKSG